MANILVVDDEEKILSSLKSALERRGHDVVTAPTVADGRRFSTAEFDVIFLDVWLPDGNGIDLLEEILKRDRKRTVVMISGHADIDTAVQAIRLGAYDFIEKPISLDRVLVTIDNATRAHALRDERERLSSRVFGDLLGESKPMMELRRQIVNSAEKTSRFLVLGENGTGKELVAHMLHRHSHFADGPFVAVNCAALPKDLVESELFGHTAGAFTGASKSRKGKFQEAHNGSLFLDEISEMTLSAQAKILRVVESRTVTPVGSEKTVPVQGNIVAASNRDLDAMVASGEFRQDLLYRLNVVQLHAPPLRKRRSDIPLLARHFLTRFADETGSSVPDISSDAIDQLKTYDYPGNVRELKNIIERLSIYASNGEISSEDVRNVLPERTHGDTGSLREAVDKFELEYIRKCIDRHDGNITAAAKELGIERSLVYKKLRRLKSE